MAMGIWLPGGGGADLDVVTADAGDVLAGKVIVGPDGEPLTGTLALSGNASDGQVLSGQTYYNTDAKTKRTGTMPNRGAVNQSLAINGSYTIPAGYHNGSGKVTQDIPTKGAQTYTPGTTNQTIAANQYLTGPQTIKGDPNLKPENIKKGVSIMGIIGTHDGFVPGPLDIYNRGSWGSGYSQSSIVDASSEGHETYNSNNIEIVSYKRVSGGKAASNFSVRISKNGELFNLSPYKSVNVMFSDPDFNTLFERDVTLEVPGVLQTTGSITGAEQTLTLNLSAINVTGVIQLRAKVDQNNSVFIHRVWFT